MKRLVSNIIVIFLIAVTIIPCYATTDGTNLLSSKNELMADARNYMQYYAYNNMTMPYYFPSWSETTANKSIELYEEIESYTYNSIEDVETERAKLDELCATATVHKSELEFMIQLFENEGNLNNYYDSTIWNEFLTVLEDGKEAYNSGSEEEIHIAYVNMRNEFNKICLYNKTMGDVNNDGIVNVLDATILQKASVDLVKLNSSQLMVAYDNSSSIITPDVNDATVIQKISIGRNCNISNYGKHINDLENLGDLPLYPAVRRFGYDTDPCNAVYYQRVIDAYNSNIEY